jgi:tetratricopeptide (TPR) repeat protein
LQALEVCRYYYPRFRDFEPLCYVYAWSIYYTAIAGKADKVRLDDLLKAANGILILTRQEDVYSPYSLAVSKVLDRLKGTEPFPATKVLEWTSKLRPELLDANPVTFEDKEGISRKLVSKREQFYLLRCKALFITKAFEDCLETVNQALAAVTTFTAGTDIWLNRYKALSLAETGKPEAALSILQQIWLSKKEWFIAGEIAGLLAKAGDLVKSLDWHLKALLIPGDDSKRLNVFKSMAKVLMESGKMELALQHYEVVALIRAENDWRADVVVAEILSTNKYVVGKEGSSVVVLKSLNRSWMALQESKEQRLQGKILSLLPHGKAGFIGTIDNQSYYFEMRSVRGDRRKVVVGCEVSFVLEEGFDQRKQRKVMNAVRVVPGIQPGIQF